MEDHDLVNSSAASTSASSKQSSPNKVPENGLSFLGSAGTTIAMNLNIPWLINLESRKEELCKYFNLPLDQNLIDDFNCGLSQASHPEDMSLRTLCASGAIRKRVLLQGRLFVFNDYVRIRISTGLVVGIVRHMAQLLLLLPVSFIGLTCRSASTQMFLDM